VIRDLLECIGVDMVGVDEHEAEDVIATWSGSFPVRSRSPVATGTFSRLWRTRECASSIRRSRAWP
jgi:hypothetical protein